MRARRSKSLREVMRPSDLTSPAAGLALGVAPAGWRDAVRRAPCGIALLAMQARASSMNTSAPPPRFRDEPAWLRRTSFILGDWHFIADRYGSLPGAFPGTESLA